MNEKVSKDRALDKLKQLIGKNVSSAFNAYGYVLYIELGKLTTYQDTTPGGKKFDRTDGEYTLAVEGIWKFSEKGKVKLNCVTADRNEIDSYLKKLLGSKIESVEIDNKKNLTKINLGNGIVLTVEKDGDNTQLWSMTKFKTKKWVSFEVKCTQEFRK